ncbi:MAG: zinc-dependent peptidase [Rhodocyclaceae bacterium]|nr:zinc-dependent peptidase [Rhodocyclaceae bacterium]
MLKRLKSLWEHLTGCTQQTAGTLVSSDQWMAAEVRLPFLNHLSANERMRLRELSLHFIQSKAWQGAQGLEVSLEMQLDIALQACLLILHRDLREYADWVEIIIYPGDFIIPRQEIDDAGVVHEYDDHVMGEAWDHGPVLISWFDDSIKSGHDGVNVVIHEFAHKLDMTNGGANGLPSMPAAARAQWINTFETAYADFCQRVDAAEETCIDPYAATDPAEFFAVVSEVFFETPALLIQHYPVVHSELVTFYGQTPR